MPLGIIPFPFGKCRICQDKATGLHYGVATCEGCKGFFKRSTLRGNKYTCYFGGNCEITPKNRNRCKSCRYKRCNEVGMALDAVRMGRIPKVEKEKVLEVFQQCGSDYNKLELSVHQSEKGSYNFNLNPSAHVSMETDSPEQSSSNSKPVGDNSTDPSDEKANFHNSDEKANFRISDEKANFQQSLSDNLSEKGHFQGNLTSDIPDKITYFQANPADDLIGNSQSKTVSGTLPIKEEVDFTDGCKCYAVDDSSSFMTQSPRAAQIQHSMQRQHSSEHTEYSEEISGNQHSTRNQHARLGQHIPQSQHTVQSQHASHSQHSTQYQRTYQNQHLVPIEHIKQSQVSSQIWPAAHSEHIKQSQGTYHNQHTTHDEHITQSQHTSQNPHTVSSEHIMQRHHTVQTQMIKSGQSDWYPNPQERVQNFNQYTRKGNQYGNIATDPASQDIETWTKVSPYTHCIKKDISQSRTFYQGSSTACMLNKFNTNNSTPWPTHHDTFQNYIPLDMRRHREELHPQDMKNTCFNNQNNNERPIATHIPFVNTDDINVPEKEAQIGEGSCQQFFERKSKVDGCNSFSKLNIAVSEGFTSVPNLTPFSSSSNLICSTQSYLTRLSVVSPAAMLQEKSSDLSLQRSHQESGITGPDVPLNNVPADLHQSTHVFSAKKHSFTQSSAHANCNVHNEHKHKQESDKNHSEANSFKKLKESPATTSHRSAGDVQKATPDIDDNPLNEEKLHKFINELAESDVTPPRSSGSCLPHEDQMEKEESCSPKTDMSDVSFKDSQSISSRSSSSSRFNSSIVKILSNLITEATARQRLTDRLKQILSFKDRVYVESVINLMQNELQNILSQMGTKGHGQKGEDSSCELTGGNPSDNDEMMKSKRETLKRFLDDIKNFPEEMKFADGDGCSNAVVTSTNNITGNKDDGCSDENNGLGTSKGYLSENKEEIEVSLTSLNLAMRILYRLKPEHREKIKLFQKGKINMRVMTDSDEDVAFVYDRIMTSIPMLNERVFGFCEHVPNFSTIHKDDRSKLIKRAYYDIWMMTYAEYFNDGKSNIILSTGEIYSIEAMRKILNDGMVDTMLSFAEQFNTLELTDLEICILCSVQLTKADSLEVEDRQPIRELHSNLLNLFVYELERNHPRDYAQLITRIYQLLPLLEEINRLQKTVIGPMPAKYKKTA